jgi:hypothetical protein
MKALGVVLCLVAMQFFRASALCQTAVYLDPSEITIGMPRAQVLAGLSQNYRVEKPDPEKQAAIGTEQWLVFAKDSPHNAEPLAIIRFSDGAVETITELRRWATRETAQFSHEMFRAIGPLTDVATHPKLPFASERVAIAVVRVLEYSGLSINLTQRGPHKPPSCPCHVKRGEQASPYPLARACACRTYSTPFRAWFRPTMSAPRSLPSVPRFL